MRKNDSSTYFTYLNLLILHMWLQVINNVKVTHQGKGHIKVKIKYLHSFKFYVVRTLCKRVVCIRLKCYLFVYKIQNNFKTISSYLLKQNIIVLESFRITCLGVLGEIELVLVNRKNMKRYQ